jgi:hypothetical protein
VLDIVIAAIGLGLVLLSVSLVYSNSRGRLMVHISGAEGEWLQPLDRPAVIEVPGPLGITVVHIENNSVHIEKSPVQTKPVSPPAISAPPIYGRLSSQ